MVNTTLAVSAKQRAVEDGRMRPLRYLRSSALLVERSDRALQIQHKLLRLRYLAWVPIIAMTTLLKPSAFIPKGLQVQQIRNLTLFKFTDALGERMQTLLDKRKADSLTPEETLELEAIGELDEIFSYINAVMASRSNEHS